MKPASLADDHGHAHQDHRRHPADEGEGGRQQHQPGQPPVLQHHGQQPDHGQEGHAFNTSSEVMPVPPPAAGVSKLR